MYQQLELRYWALGGHQGAIPHALKQRIVKEHASRHRLETLVETGTYLGDMVWAAKDAFRDIHTIELEPSLYRRAVHRFAHEHHVHLYLGDSAEVMAGVVATLKGPALFWLDGHFSGGLTAKGRLETPIIAELSAIFADNKDHIVLIDDAAEFTGHGDYPSIDGLRSLLLSLSADLQVTIADDIIRVRGRPNPSLDDV